MAFAPQSSPQALPAATPSPTLSTPAATPSEAALTYDARTLQQDTQAKEDMERRKPESVDLAEQDSRVRSLQSMNAIRLLAPAIRAASLKGGTEQEQVSYFVTLLNRANADAVRAAVSLGLEPDLQKNRWAVNSLERVFVEAYAGVDVAQAPKGSALADAVLEAGIARQFEAHARQFWSQEMSIRLGLIQALLPIARAQATFDFLRQRDEDLEHCAQLLLTTALLGVEQLCQPMTPDHERQSLCLVLLHEGGQTLAHVWAQQTQRATVALAGKSKQAIAAWRAAHPQGLPLDPVVSGFEQMMHRVIQLARKVRPQVRAR